MGSTVLAACRGAVIEHRRSTEPGIVVVDDWVAIVGQNKGGLQFVIFTYFADLALTEDKRTEWTFMASDGRAVAVGLKEGAVVIDGGVYDLAVGNVFCIGRKGGVGQFFAVRTGRYSSSVQEEVQRVLYDEDFTPRFVE